MESLLAWEQRRVREQLAATSFSQTKLLNRSRSQKDFLSARGYYKEKKNSSTHTHSRGRGRRDVESYILIIYHIRREKVTSNTFQRRASCGKQNA